MDVSEESSVSKVRDNSSGLVQLMPLLNTLRLPYSASLFLELVFSCTKISMTLLIRQINNYARLRIAIRPDLGIILIKSCSGIIATAFRCILPSPWRAKSFLECPGATAVYLVNGIGNIITNTLLCALSVAIVWNVESDVKKKTAVKFLFTSRVL